MLITKASEQLGGNHARLCAHPETPLESQHSKMGRDRLPFMYFSEILVLLVKKTINVCSISLQPHFIFNVIITFNCNYFFSCCFWCSFETRSHAPQAGLSLLGNQGWPLAPPASIFQVLYYWATPPALTKQLILPFFLHFSSFSPFLFPFLRLSPPP